MYILNDLHGAEKLIAKACTAIRNLKPGENVVINGDGAGARGPRMSKLVKVFYEVRRGETAEAELVKAAAEIIGFEPEIPKEWIYNTVHAGLFRKLMADRYEPFADCLHEELLAVLEETLKPIAEAAEAAQVKVYYLPGNGEITPDDFSTEDIMTEVAIAPNERFYQKIAREGFFRKYDIQYVPYAAKLEDAVLLSANLLDLGAEKAIEMLKQHNFANSRYTEVIAHYPPTISRIGGAFDFWTPNKTDIRRAEVLAEILRTLNLDDATVYFGHIHLAVNDARMNAYPSFMGFRNPKSTYVWVKPGEVIKI